MPWKSQEYTFKGKTQALEEWAKEYGIRFQTLADRLNKGQRFKDALTRPVRKSASPVKQSVRRPKEWNQITNEDGEEVDMQLFADFFGVTVSAIYGAARKRNSPLTEEVTRRRDEIFGAMSDDEIVAFIEAFIQQNGKFLGVLDICRWLSVTRAELFKSAKKHNLAPAQEMLRRKAQREEFALKVEKMLQERELRKQARLANKTATKGAKK